MNAWRWFLLAVAVVAACVHPQFGVRASEPAGAKPPCSATSEAFTPADIQRAHESLDVLAARLLTGQRCVEPGAENPEHLSLCSQKLKEFVASRGGEHTYVFRQNKQAVVAVAIKDDGTTTYTLLAQLNCQPTQLHELRMVGSFLLIMVLSAQPIIPPASPPPVQSI